MKLPWTFSFTFVIGFIIENKLFLGKRSVKKDFDVAISGTSLRFDNQVILRNALLIIHKALENGKTVLIYDNEEKHCSACIVAAYLIKRFGHYGVTAEHAAIFLKSKRPIVALDEVDLDLK